MPQGQRREQLVEAAIEVMRREGVRGATTRAVAAEAEVSLSVFHYCFDSKADLLEQVVRTLAERTADEVSRAISAAVTTSGNPVRASLAAYWEHVTSHPAEHLLTYEVTQHCLRTTGLRGIPRNQYELYASVIATHLGTAGFADQEQVEVLSRYLAVVVDGLTLAWLARGEEARADDVLDLVGHHVGTLLAPV